MQVATLPVIKATESIHDEHAANQREIEDLDSRLESIIGLKVEDPSNANMSLFADPAEDKLDASEQNSIMKQLIEQGVDLRQYSKQIELELTQVENEHVLDYVKQSQSLSTLQGDIKACDSILERMQTFLSSFQTELNKVNKEIQDLQDKSRGMETQVKNRSQIQRQLTAVLDGIVLGPDLLTKICEGEINEFYLEDLKELDRKMTFLKAQQGKHIRAFKDVAPEFERLRLRASEKNRDYLQDKFKLLKQVGNNAQQIQLKELLPYRDLYAFLADRFSETATEVRQTYVNTMSAYYNNAMYRFLKIVLKVHSESRFEWIGGGSSLHVLGQSDEASIFGFSQLPGAPNSSMFTNVVDGVSKLSVSTYNTISTLSSSINRSGTTGSTGRAPQQPFNLVLKERLNIIRSVNMGIVPISEGEIDLDDENSFPTEALFKSLFRVWVDNASSEFIFVNEFFAVPVHQKNQQRRSLARKTSATTSKNISTVDVIPAATIWADVMDSTTKYVIGSVKSLVNQCYDAISILQCIRLNALNIMVMQKRNIAVLEPFFDSINLMLWPRFQLLVEGHIKSIREADAKRLWRAMLNPSVVQGTTIAQAFTKLSEFEIAEAIGPHPVTRRFAEFLAIVLCLCVGFDDAVIASSLSRLRSEVEAFLGRMVEEIPAVAANSVKQRYRTMFLINNYDLIATVLGNSISLSQGCEKERHYYIDKIEKILNSA